jgi:hypothetical protein
MTTSVSTVPPITNSHSLTTNWCSIYTFKNKSLSVTQITDPLLKINGLIENNDDNRKLQYILIKSKLLTLLTLLTLDTRYHLCLNFKYIVS